MSNLPNFDFHISTFLHSILHVANTEALGMVEGVQTDHGISICCGHVKISLWTQVRCTTKTEINYLFIKEVALHHLILPGLKNTINLLKT
jgi:hypothetical protein